MVTKRKLRRRRQRKLAREGLYRNRLYFCNLPPQVFYFGNPTLSPGFTQETFDLVCKTLMDRIEKSANQPTLEFVSNDEYLRRLAASKPSEGE